MRIQFVGDPDSADRDMSQLYGWLMRNPKILRHCKIELKGNTEGAMGSAEIVNIVFSNSLAAANLALAYMTYRKALPRSAEAVINIEGGVQFIRLGSDPEEGARTLTQLVQAAELSAHADPASGEAQEDGTSSSGTA